MKRLGLALLLTGCTQQTPTEERVIHILVEGGECEEPAASPTPVIAAATAAATEASASPESTAVVPVPRSTLPEGTEERRFAVLGKLRAISTTLERKDIDYHDVPAVADAMRKSFELLPRQEFAEAMVHAELAEDAARDAALNLDVVDRRLKRVQKRLEDAAPKLSGRKPVLDRDWQQAQSLIVANHLVLANQKLVAIERVIDEAEGIAQAPE